MSLQYPSVIKPINVSNTNTDTGRIILPDGFSGLFWLAAAALEEPKSANKFGAVAVIGGDRGEGNVICWTADVAGQPEEETLACTVAGRCTGWVWFAAGRAVAG